ncbi:P-loop containing nucleoside triphosphate hydrolase protein, partial [Coprinopsis marcescibilis]
MAIEQVMALKTDVIAILATGGGKTMIALIPTLLDGDVSIFVLPLISLITDYKRKLDAMGVAYEIFDGTLTPFNHSTNIILVSVDRCHSGAWRECILELCEYREVTRMFFDEAHLALTAINFRPALVELSKLRFIRMQFILLTATCPP